MQKRILVYGMTDNPGGIETYLMNQMRSLDSEKVKFDFITDFPNMVYAQEVENSGSKIYYIPAKSKGVLAHWRAFARVLRTHREYEKIYFNILDAGAAITMLIPWLYGRTIITHSHNGSTDKKQLHRLCKPFLNLFTKKRLACSRLAAEFMFGNQKAVVIPNAIRSDLFDFNEEIRAKKRKELDIETNFVICHIGRLSLQKNPKGLIDIFDILYRKDPKAVLLSVGDGEMKEELLQYASEKACFDGIHFLGKRQDISDILQAADVFLLPSFYEGLPIVAIEAQAAGLPCVLSSNVSKEAKITDLVYYLSLEQSLDEWADLIFSLKDFDRTSVRNEIIQSGYDVHYPCEAEIELKKYFENQ